MIRSERDRDRRERQSSSSAAAPSTSNVESTVTRLLVAIKQLLEALTLWSTGKMTEQQVSDVYVRLGNDFNMAVAAFAAFNIDMSELLTMPEDLRDILEQALSEEANPANLEVYLPQVREIITRLLQGLRSRQSIYRRNVADRNDQKHNRSDTGSTSSRHERMDSHSSSSRASERGSHAPPENPQRYSSASRGPTTSQLDEDPRHRSSRRSSSRHKDSIRPQAPTEPLPEGAPFVGGFGPYPQQQQSQRTSAVSPELAADAAAAERLLAFQPISMPQPARYVNGNGASPAAPSNIDTQRRTSGRSPQLQSEHRSTPPPQPLPTPSSPPPQIPQLPAISPDVKRWSLTDPPVAPPIAIDASSPILTFSEPPPPPPLSPADTPAPTTPVIESSLAALKKSDVLERRASKRFSTYTITKMSGGSAGPSREKGTPSRAMATPNGTLTSSDLYALTEESEDTPTPGKKRDKERPELARVKSSDSLKRSRSRDGKSRPPMPTLPIPISQATPIDDRGQVPLEPPTNTLKPPDINHVDLLNDTQMPASPSGASLSSSQTLTIFLQHDRKVKKVVIDPPNSFSAVRVLFVDKFMYNPGQDNFPAIYIRDPSSGVQYELEDVTEIHDRCLLSLNVEPLDQLRHHIDSQMGALSQDLRDLKAAVTSVRRMSMPPSNQSPAHIPQEPVTPSRPTDRQFHNFATKLMRMKSEEKPTPSITASASAPVMSPLVPHSTGGSSWTYTSDIGSGRIVSDLKVQFDEVQNLRRDLGILRQLYVDFNVQTKESLSTLRTQTQTVRDLANSKIAGERAYLDSGKVKLDSRSQDILTRVEELQDMVENLKDDVLKRHIMPKGTVMKTIKADIQKSSADLQSLTQHMTTVKPVWKRTWETELQNIVEEQQFLSHQEELVNDLLEDHKALVDVFGHVEKVVALRNTAPRSGRSGKSFPRQHLAPDDTGGSFNNVMAEIQGASVDPQRRMKAIEATQKARQRELESRSDEFQDELSSFLSGKKLKMTGGAEEAERIRQKKNESSLKAMFTNGPTTPLSPSMPPSPAP